MNSEELKQVKTVSGPYYYSNGEGEKILHLPTTLTDNVKAVNEEGTASESLKNIIAEQFAIMELGLKRDICNLYVSTQGLHGNHIQLSGNATVMSVKEHRNIMNVDGEVDPTLPYIEI